MPLDLTISGTGTISVRPGGDGSTRIINLGLLDIASLDDGPQTLYEPAEGDFVAIIFGPDGYAEHDIDDGNGDAVIGQNPTLNPDDYLFFLAVVPDILDLPDVFRGSAAKIGGVDADKSLVASFMQTDDAVVAYNITGFGAPFPASKPAWQAGHVYAEGDFVTIAGPHWLCAGNAGTSDVAEPAWPGDGDNVQDNDIFWNAVTPTTQGAIHLYAVVSTPADP